MKKLSVFAACLFFLWLTFNPLKGQSDIKSKWSVGIIFSPDYAYRVLNSDDYDDVWKEFLDENDKPKFGYTTGISVLNSFNSSFELESALLFSSKGYVYKASGEEGQVFPETESFTGWEKNDPAVPPEAIRQQKSRPKTGRLLLHQYHYQVSRLIQSVRNLLLLNLCHTAPGSL